MKDISHESNHTYNTFRSQCLECLCKIPVFITGIRKRQKRGEMHQWICINLNF